MQDEPTIAAPPAAMAMPATSPDGWQSVRADYEANELSVDEICARHGVTRAALAQHRRQQGWTPRSQSRTTNRALIVRKFYDLLNRQISQLEQDMKTQTGETEAVLLHKLATTLEKLMAIDAAAGSRQRERSAPSRDMLDLKNRLAQRIEQLKRG